jgi:hypothetical protein
MNRVIHDTGVVCVWVGVVILGVDYFRWVLGR